MKLVVLAVIALASLGGCVGVQDDSEFDPQRSPGADQPAPTAPASQESPGPTAPTATATQPASQSGDPTAATRTQLMRDGTSDWGAIKGIAWIQMEHTTNDHGEFWFVDLHPGYNAAELLRAFQAGTAADMSYDDAGRLVTIKDAHIVSIQISGDDSGTATQIVMTRG